MYYIFLLIFLFILAAFLIISGILLYHAIQYRLPEKDISTKPLVIVYIVVSVLLLLISIIAFFNIPWDVISF